MRLKLVMLLVLSIGLWFGLRGEMCSKPPEGVMGQPVMVRYFDGHHPTAVELLAFDGAVVDICAVDPAYGGDLICQAAMALYTIGGPGRLWLCPCSIAGQRLTNGVWRYPVNQLTCEAS